MRSENDIILIFGGPLLVFIGMLLGHATVHKVHNYNFYNHAIILNLIA